MVYPLWGTFLWPWYRLWISEVKGIENIPKKGAFIVVMNHSSFYDIVLPHGIVARRLDKKIHPFVNSRFWNSKITAKILDNGECIPVFISDEKGAKSKNKKSINLALNYLKKGELVAVFPEGKRSTDGVLRKAYNGASKLSFDSNAPILPIGIIDSYKVLPKGAFFPRFHRCKVKIGKPVYPSAFKAKGNDKKLLDEMSRKFMKEIALIIGQKYNY